MPTMALWMYPVPLPFKMPASVVEPVPPYWTESVLVPEILPVAPAINRALLTLETVSALVLAPPAKVWSAVQLFAAKVLGIVVEPLMNVLTA